MGVQHLADAWATIGQVHFENNLTGLLVEDASRATVRNSVTSHNVNAFHCEASKFTAEMNVR